VSRQAPPLARDDFARRLTGAAPVELVPAVVDALYAHYRELLRWSGRMSLLGPGDADLAPERHYGEALAALPLLPAGSGTLLDVGSGAGFPGLVIAAARPDLAVTLLEPRERRWAFLMAACRSAGLACRCLHGRLDLPLSPDLPASLDVATIRALKLDVSLFDALAERLTPGGRILLWAGENDPELPPGLEVRRSVRLEGSRVRRILEVRQWKGREHRGRAL
jgi:16S rRNA G527 N7-methylase RsmG